MNKSLIHLAVATLMAPADAATAAGGGAVAAAPNPAAPAPAPVAATVAAANVTDNQQAAAPGTVANPAAATETQQAAVEEQQLDPNAPFVLQPLDFHFKEEKDDAGKKTGFKRPSAKLQLPMPTAIGIMEALTAGGKQADLVLEAVGDVVYTMARQQINNAIDKDSKVAVDQTILDLSQLSWEAIANMPRAERAGGGIAKEVWEAFQADYIAVMPEAFKAASIQKSTEQITNQAKLMFGKFNACKTNKPVLGALRDCLALWYNSTPNKEEFQPCYDFLDEKADSLLKVSDEALLANV